MYQNLAVDIGNTFLGTGHFLTQLGGVSKLTTALVANILVVLGIILVFTIIYAGISMVSAGGDSQQYERARHILTAGITGFVIAVAAWFIVRIIETSTGLGSLKIFK